MSNTGKSPQILKRAKTTRSKNRASVATVLTQILIVGLAFSTVATVASAEEPTSTKAKQDDSTVVIVTGSRIHRRDFQSDSPISTIDKAVLTASGQPSLDRAIGQMPQFAGAQGASEVGDAQGSIGFSGGQSYSDLRGIGPNRSLVLVDGRRLMPSSPEGTIDLNTVPTSMIESVEVITGGASATYGSDAVAGVVNFKLRQKFSGAEITVQHGGSFRGDGATNDVSALVGGNYADDRGNGVFSYEYSDRATVVGSDRSFFANIRELARPSEGIIAAGNYGGGAPTFAAVNAVLSGYSGTTPLVGSGAYNGAIGVNTDGTLFTDLSGTNCVQNYKGVGITKGTNISANCHQVQVGLGNYFAVLVPLKKQNIFARSTFKVNDHVTLYGQVNFMESQAVDQTGPGSTKATIPLIIPQNSPFVTGNPALSSILASISPTPTNPIYLTKLLTAFGNRVETFKYDVWQAVGGAKGDIPGTQIDWDVYGSVGSSQFINKDVGDVSNTAVTKILNGTANFSGSAGTCTGYAWNPFGNNALSAGCLQYAGRTDQNINTMNQKVFEGTLEGPLLTLPGGEARFAVGADYRQTDFTYQPDPTLLYNDSIAYGSINAASGKQKVSELFGELLIPIVKDLPLAQELSLDLGARSSHYSVFGKNNTWKADLSWKPADFLRLRGGYSVAIRAPSLSDLYGPTATSQLNIGTLPNAGDPCAVGSSFRTGANSTQVLALCAAEGIPASILPTYTYGVTSVQGTSGSNPNLTPEQAHTWSIGAVVTPTLSTPLFQTLQISVDYYNIQVNNAIGSLSLTDILPRCFNSDGVSNPGYSVTNAYCQRIQRDPLTGVISSGQEGLFNFATYRLDGIDTQFNWRFGLDALGLPSNAGRIDVNSVVSYLKNYDVAGLLGSPTLNYAGSVGFGGVGGVGGDISHPKWKSSTGIGYTLGDFSTTLRWRYIDKMIHSDLVQNAAATTPGVPAYNYFDIDAHYNINRSVTLSLGVTNLGDKAPPFVSGAPLTTDGATYDVIGRTWYISLKAKM